MSMYCMFHVRTFRSLSEQHSYSGGEIVFDCVRYMKAFVYSECENKVYGVLRSCFVYIVISFHSICFTGFCLCVYCRIVLDTTSFQLASSMRCLVC